MTTWHVVWRLLRAHPRLALLNVALATAVAALDLLPGPVTRAFFDRLATPVRAGVGVEALIAALLALALARTVVKTNAVLASELHQFAAAGTVRRNLLAGIVKLSLLGTVGGLKVGNDRFIGDRIRLVQALATARTGSVWGGFVQSKLNVTVPPEPLRQIAPGDTGPVAIQDRLHEQPIVAGRPAHMPRSPVPLALPPPVSPLPHHN